MKPISLPIHIISPDTLQLPLTDRPTLKPSDNNNTRPGRLLRIGSFGAGQSDDKNINHQNSTNYQNYNVQNNSNGLQISNTVSIKRLHNNGTAYEPGSVQRTGMQRFSSYGHSIATSASPHSPLLSPGLHSNPIIINEPPFTLETPANPSFKLQSSSFSPFRELPVFNTGSRSPVLDMDDQEDIMGGIGHWKAGISPPLKSATPNSGSRVTVSSTNSPNLLPREPPSRDTDLEGVKLAQFLNMVNHPPVELLEETKSIKTIADYATTLAELIGSHE